MAIAVKPPRGDFCFLPDQGSQSLRATGADTTSQDGHLRLHPPALPKTRNCTLETDHTGILKALKRPAGYIPFSLAHYSVNI